MFYSKEKNRAVVICGPTASGKTDLAHELAKKHDGEIINADSMQLYKHIPVITASPSDEQKSELPYHLYNFVDENNEYSAVKYVKQSSNIIKNINSQKKLPIIVGGSGMYINMLVNGYSKIADIDPKIRLSARKLYDTLGAEAFFQELKKLDPEITKILNIKDQQRTIRAYEVIKQTDKSILYFQKEDNIKLLPEFEFYTIVLMPERNFLYNKCNERFVKILNSGALDEAKFIKKTYPNLKTTASKALGLSEILLYLDNKISVEKIVELASTKTRQYAKRQCTWFNNQYLPNKKILNFNNIEEYKEILNLNWL